MDMYIGHRIPIAMPSYRLYREASEHRGLQAKQQEDQSKAAQEVQQRCAP